MEAPAFLLSLATGVSASLEPRGPSVKLTIGTSVCTTSVRTAANVLTGLETMPAAARSSTEAKTAIYLMYPQRAGWTSLFLAGTSMVASEMWTLKRTFDAASSLTVRARLETKSATRFATHSPAHLMTETATSASIHGSIVMPPRVE